MVSRRSLTEELPPIGQEVVLDLNWNQTVSPKCVVTVLSIYYHSHFVIVLPGSH